MKREKICRTDQQDEAENVPEEKKAADRERLAEKLQAMTAGDLLSLVHAKVENTWGRGSNGYPVYLENCLRTDGLYPYLFGDHKDFVIIRAIICACCLVFFMICYGQSVKSNGTAMCFS